MIDPQTLGLRERAGQRKAALDAGFGVRADGPNRVFGSSSHAPLSCAVAEPVDAGGYGVGPSMATVIRALDASATAPPLDMRGACAAAIGAASRFSALLGVSISPSSRPAAL